MPEQNPKVRQRLWTAQLVAYVMILFVALWGFYAIGRQTNQLCDNATVNRLAVRQLTTAIAHLGEQLVVGDAGAPVTAAQRATLHRFQDFKRQTLRRLPVTPCP